jgi:hypothetical protein
MKFKFSLKFRFMLKLIPEKLIVDPVPWTSLQTTDIGSSNLPSAPKNSYGGIVKRYNIGIKLKMRQPVYLEIKPLQ